MSSWRFEPVVNVGNVLSVFIMFGGLVGVYVNIREVQIKQEARLISVERSLEDNRIMSRAAVEKLVEIQIDIASIRALYQNQVEVNSDDRRQYPSSGYYERQ